MRPHSSWVATPLLCRFKRQYFILDFFARIPLMQKPIVFDVGARYGIHPSWRQIFDLGLCEIHAFEPEREEYLFLRKKYSGNTSYIINDLALGSHIETRSLNLLRHRGQSSFYEPNYESAWFGTTRSSDGTIDGSQINCKVIRADHYIERLLESPQLLSTNVIPNLFIKTDTEGFDLEVLKGFGRYLQCVSAIRSEMHFDKTFHNAPGFASLLSFAEKHEFRVANIDYDGSGSPQSYFIPPGQRSGILCGCEVLFIRSDSYYMSQADSQFLSSLLFLMHNALADYAVKLMLERPDPIKNSPESLLAQQIKKLFLYFSKQMQDRSPLAHQRAMIDYKAIFSEPYPEFHDFFSEYNKL